MNDPTETALRQALREHGDEISPTPALPGILHRANASSARTWPRWAGVGVAGLATAGLVTGVVLTFGPAADDGAPVTAGPSQQVEGPNGEAVAVEPGTVVPMALHFGSEFDGGTLVSGEFEVTSTGDLGVDAVSTLLTTEPRGPFLNWWAAEAPDDPGSDPAPREVRSVRVSAEQITVDFNYLCYRDAVCVPPDDAELALQQLVHTLQSVLRSDAPVLLTVDGAPASEAFGVPLDGPIPADPSVAPGIRVSSPEQGTTLSGPLVVTGESTSFEGTVLWAAEQDGEVVDEGFTTGGSMGEFGEFELSIDLAPGDYTVKLWEENAAGGAEGLAARLSPVYLDVTVR